MALFRRFFWRFRWKLTQRPWIIPFWSSLKIVLPKSAAGSLIYYQGFSEPETADFILQFLKPGMVFFDIGAHIGEYTILGAHAVGPQGEVHAFEPHPTIFKILRTNIELNQLTNVNLNNCAVCDSEQEREFELCAEPSVSSLRRNLVHKKGQDTTIIQTRCVLLDTYWVEQYKKIDLVKMDIEGAEMLALRGAEKLLGLPGSQAPIWVFEYWGRNLAGYGWRPEQLFEFFRMYGYSIWRRNRMKQMVPVESDFCHSGVINLIASKDPRHLETMVRNS